MSPPSGTSLLLHPPSHPSRSSQSTMAGLPVLYSNFPPAIDVTRDNTVSYFKIPGLHIEKQLNIK